MSPEEINAIVSILSGPASSVCICILVGYASWKLFVCKILPQHDAQFERLMNAHEKDREIFRDAVATLVIRLEQVEDDIKDVKRKVGA